MANINARSPYLINYSSVSEVTLKVWIYTGTQLTSHTGTPTYTLTSTPINGEVTFDIALLVKDYFDVNFNGNYNTEILWVDYQIDSEAVVQNTAFYGYGYFEEGVNPQNVKGLSNGVYNYIGYSDDFSQWEVGGSNTISSEKNGNSEDANCVVTINATSNRELDFPLDEPLPVGQEVTISVWFRNDSGSAVTTGTRDFQLAYYNGGTYVEGGNVSVDLSDTSTFHLKSYTFVVPDTLVTSPEVRINGGNGAIGEKYRLYNAGLYLGGVQEGKLTTNGQAGVSFEDKIAVKLSVNSIYKPTNESFRLPVFANETKAGSNGGLIEFYKEGIEYPNIQYTIVSDQDESTDVVQYINAASDVDRVDVTYYLDSSAFWGFNRTVIGVNNVCEPKYTPYKLTFINKYGVLEDLWFFKNSKLSLETKEESYRSNIVSSGSYSINNHQYRTLYKEGKESLTINSGFYPESHNEAFKQLLLSEQVWINYKGQTLPIRIKDSSISFQDKLTEKNINYTMNIEFAFDKINNVR